MTSKSFFYAINSLPKKNRSEGVDYKSVSGEKITMAFYDLEPGSIVSEHNHPHEQMGYVISGELEFTVGGETKLCKPGDIYHVPGDVLHSVKVTLDGPAKVLDIFSPPREDR